MTTKTVRYHLQLDEGRTSISLDKIVSDLMAIKLGTKPETKEAHQAVSNHLDKFIASDRGRSASGLSQYITKHAVLFITDKIISDKYDEWWTEQCEKELL